jgi:RND superfamily putative drug exporter
VWWLAKAGVVLLSGQTQGILFILVIGASTDYSLLYVARYREALGRCRTRWEATRTALRGSFEPILASGGTVIAGLLCLLLSDLNSNKALGPVAAIGIVFAMAASLTLLPSLLLWAGRAAFWPRRPRFDPAGRPADAVEKPGRGAWARWSGLVARRPRAIWVVTGLVLLAACAGVLQLRADGVPSSDLVLGQSEARDGQAALGVHFPDGSGSPAYVVAPADRYNELASTLLADDGVESVSVLAADSPSGTARVTEDGVQAFGAPGTPAPAPTVVDSQVMLQATLADAADSAAAEQTVRGLRDRLGGEVLVGGVTATAIDSNDASIHDRNIIIPVILVVILAILMLLLRSVLAPVLLILTVVLSFGAAMGVSALVFNHLLGFPGADPAVPLYGFVFLVALGIDYNIFLMTRVREEALAHGTRAGILRGLSVTGGVITSAGLVLAATFAALAVLPILFLAQLAFIVAFGVLLDTFVVRSLLVPALACDLGRRIWWPSQLARSS